MQDYAKTTELVDAAYNSAGSGQRQFEKTLDSLESKLTKLKNAWDEFTMGLSNNEIIGAVVSSLTTVLTSINKLIDALSGGNGLIKSVMTLGTVIGGLKVGGSLFTKALQSSSIQKMIGALSGKQIESAQANVESSGEESGEKAFSAFVTGFKNAGKGNRKNFLKGQLKDFFTIDASDMEGAQAILDEIFPKDGGLGSSYANKVFGEAFAEVDNGTRSISQFRDELIQAGVEEEKVKELINQLRTPFQRLGVDVKSVGTSLQVVGGAFTALGSVIGSISPETEELGSVIQTVGTGMMLLGTVLPVVDKGIKKIVTSQLALNLGLTASTLGIITTAVVALGGAIIAVVNSVKNNSIEKQLERASEATSKASEEAQKASKAYDDLADKKNDLNDMANSLDNLTKGSLEWKKALVELNNEVLTLKSNYPDLQIIADQETGQLSVGNWGEVLQKQLEEAQKANDRLASATIYENQLQYKADNQEVDSSKTLTDEQKALQKQANLQKLQSSNATALRSMGEDLDTELANSLSQLFSKETLKKVQTDANTFEHQTTTIIGDMFDGIEKQIEGMSKGDKKKAYESFFGIGSADDLTADEIFAGLTQAKFSEAYNEKLKQLSSLGSADQEVINVLAGNLSNTMDEVLRTGFSLQGEYSKADTSKIAKLLGMDESTLKKNFDEAENLISQSTDELVSTFETKGIDRTKYEGLSYSIVKNLSSQIAEMSAQDAQNYLDTFLHAIKNSKLDKAKQQQLANYLSTTDLTNTRQALDVKSFMEELGVNQSEIEHFWNEIDKSCQPYLKSLEDISALTEQISALGKIKDIAQEGNTFSTEDKESMVSAGFNAQDFMQVDIDKWVYVGEQTNNLVSLINDKISFIAQQITQGIQRNIEMGQQFQQVIAQNSQYAQIIEQIGAGTLTNSNQYNAELGYAVSDDMIQKIATSLGIEIAGMTTEQIVSAIKTGYEETYLKLEENRQALQQQQMSNANISYSQTGDYARSYEGMDISQQQQAMDAQLRATSGAQATYNELLKEQDEILGDTSMSEEEQELYLKNLAIQLRQLGEDYETVAGQIDEYKDALVDSSQGDHLGAIDQARQSLQTLFDFDFSDVDNSWFETYAQDIYNLAEGGETGRIALENLRQAIEDLAMNNLSETLSNAGVDVTNFCNWIENLDPTLELQTGADLNPLEQALTAIINATNGTATEVENALAPALSMIEALANVNIKYEFEYDVDPISGEDIIVGFKSLDLSSKGRTGRTFDRFTPTSRGSSSSSKSSGGGSSKSSEKKETTWENPYDKLYNLTEKINEALRQREKLEREYDRILERRGSTFGEIRKNYNEQLASLKKELQYQDQLRAGRLSELNQLASETYKGKDSDGNELIKSFSSWGVTQYANYNPSTGVIEINWDAIDKVKDENTGGAIEAYIKRLEELQTQIEDVDKTIEDMGDRIIELQKLGQQDYLDFEQKVYDAIINQEQEIIDNFQSLSDTIADTNSSILNSLQDSIDLQRQIRDNTKTEQDINEKEARLAYLRRDTSNANALEIKQLEEDLATSREDYGDSLIDQQLERLTKQNDDAQEARQKQIELMQAQLDYASQNGEYWGQAYELITSGFSANGDLNQASQLWDLLEKDEGWKGMSKFGQLNWQEEISKAILAASQGYANWNMYKAEKVDKSLTLGDGTRLTFDGSTWKDSAGNTYNGIDFDSTSNQFTYSSMKSAPKPSNTNSSGGDSSNKNIGVGSKIYAGNATIYSSAWGDGASSQYYGKDPYYTVLDELNGYVLTRHHSKKYGYSGWFKKSDVKAYKTGGIADFTGPAWLDGSKSKPELILNAKDTQNFIQLKDTLSSLLKGNKFSKETTVGDTYIDIDINVDKIDDDYDVEQLAEKVKQEIYSQSMYRNVNTINFIR